MKRLLLVCEDGCQQMGQRLVRAGCSIVTAGSGTEAIRRLKHESDKLDAAILVSTGAEMDFSETALNLRDLDSELEIIILCDEPGDQTAQIKLVANAIPQARLLSSAELTRYLGLRE